jgi:hypothetical protein
MIRQADVGVNCILHAAAGEALDTDGKPRINGGLLNSLGRAGIPGQSDFLARFARETLALTRYSSEEGLLALREELWTFSEQLLKDTLAKQQQQL